MVVDGRMQFIGSQRMLAEHAIARAVRTPKATLVLSTQDPDAAGRIRATIAVSDTAAIAADDEIEIWAAVTETGLRTAVLRGENAGRDLRHAPVVRQLVHVATRAPPLPRRFSERIELSLASDWTLDRLRLVAFLQEPENRRVWGVAQTSVSGQAAVSGQ